MGVRTASARHLHVLVMAPALTGAEQSQKFNFSPKPLKTDFDACYSQDFKRFPSSENHQALTNTDDSSLKNARGKADSPSLRGSGYAPGQLCESPEHTSSSSVINNNLRMDDQKDKMGLQKANIDAVSSLIKDKSSPTDVDQIFNNLAPDIHVNDTGTVGDATPNVDEIMQVIKSMEGTNTVDPMFSLTTDLTTNLSPFEKELLNDVDVMNMSMEDQLFDGAASIKEIRTKELILELQKKQIKMERRLDFLLRRLRKVQAKHMGQHVSNEIAGVFEHANRTLRKAKEAANSVNTSQQQAKLDISNISQEPDTKSSTAITNTNETTTPEKLKPISQTSAKSLVRKLEASTIFQAGIIARQKFTPRYFGSGSVEPTGYRSGYQNMTTLPPWSAEHKADLQKVAGSLHTQLKIVQEALDSEATASSSGGESCDEFQTYNNPHQQYLSIQKRAAWRYATERAAIASRWTWLQAQIADLEYRIRQYSDLHKLIRTNKGQVYLEGENQNLQCVTSSPSAVNGYRGQLPGASPISVKSAELPSNGGKDLDCSCARSRPLRSNFRKRKLVQISGLHAVSKKAARSSNIRCGCVSSTAPCAICTGRTDPTHPRDLTDYLSKQERISLIDPAFHPVFSFPEDVSTSIHLEAIMKSSEWQQKSTKSNFKTMRFAMKMDRLNKTSPNIDDLTKKVDHRRKYNRLLKTKIKKIRGRKPGLHSLTRLKKKRHNVRLAMAQLQSLSAEGADEETESLSNTVSTTAKTESPSSSPLLTMQTISGYSKRNSRVSSYDIDNIVIPYSVAAATRVEKLQYKEILTPKWRLVDPDFALRYTKTNGVVRDPSQDSDIEDLSDEAVLARHEKCEHEEKKKFLSYLKFPIGYGRSRSHKRTDSRAESSGGNTPDPMSPHPGDHPENSTSSPVTSPPATPLSVGVDENVPLPSVSVLRRRTVSQSARGKDKELASREDSSCGSIGGTEHVEVTPYERRNFPLPDDVYEKMLKQMPENHQFNTNVRSQDLRDGCGSPTSYLDDKVVDSPDSESTESAVGDEDPNDPEWIDMERMRDRYKR